MKTFIYNKVIYEIRPEALQCFPFIVLEGGLNYKIVQTHDWGNKDPAIPEVSIMYYSENAGWRPRSKTSKQTICRKLKQHGFENVFVARRKNS